MADTLNDSSVDNALRIARQGADEEANLSARMPASWFQPIDLNAHPATATVAPPNQFENLPANAVASGKQVFNTANDPNTYKAMAVRLAKNLYQDPIGTTTYPLRKAGEAAYHMATNPEETFTNLMPVTSTLSGISQVGEINAKLNEAKQKGDTKTYNQLLPLLAMAGVGAIPGFGGEAKTAESAVAKTAQQDASTLLKKELNYETEQSGPFYRVSRKGNGESGKIATQDDSGIWPNSPADSKGTGPIRYGDTQYDKTTYKPYKVMPADDQNAVLQTAQTYVSARGLPEVSQPKMAPSSLEKQAAIGRTYSLAVESSPEYKQEIFDAYKRTMPDVIKQSGAKNYDELLKSAYDQMAKETAEQFNTLNLRYSYHQNGEGNYADSSNMLHDLHDNNHLFVYQGGDKHDFLHNIDPQTGLNENEKFRAVHDAFGHGIYGNTFGPEGEERAWGVHSQMYSPLAQLAMTAETRGQNSFVNYTPANVRINEAIREVESKMAEAKKRGDVSNLKELQEAKKSLYGEWNYAPNKSVLLPPEFLSTSYSGEMPSYIQKLIKPAEETTFSSPLTHYSFSPFLGQTDPYQYGTGLRGAERNRVLSGGIKGRSYFYLGEPGTVTPEAGVGPTRYAAQGKNLYNLADDPEKLYRLAKQSNLSSPLSNFNPNSIPHDQIMNDFEKLIRQYGYSGYAQPNQGFPTAVMFDPVTVQRRNIGGTVEDHAMNLVRRYLDHEDDHAA